MKKIRLVDQFWEKMGQLSLTLESDVTHLKITHEGLDELLSDYREEFYKPDATVDDLQSYIGLEILTAATSRWSGSDKFKLLKTAEYGEW